MKLSIIINVKNGEQFLERCLKSVMSFDDVVLFDNYSTDNTVVIAKKFSNVRVYQQEFCGMGRVRNLATTHAKYDWVLVVDCDEVLDRELVKSLDNMTFEAGYVYKFKRQNYYDNCLVSSSAWENDWMVRLYNRLETKYSEVEVHEAVITNGLKIKKHDGIIYHFPYSDVSSLINKLQIYSTSYAIQNYKHKKPQLFLIPFRAFFMFIKCYILKHGFMDGFRGLTISMYNAMGVFSKYIKLYELQHKWNLGLIINITNINELDRAITLIYAQIVLPVYVVIYSDLELVEMDKILKSNLAIPYVLCKTSTSQELVNTIHDGIKVDSFYHVKHIDELSNCKLLFKVRSKFIK